MRVLPASDFFNRLNEVFEILVLAFEFHNLQLILLMLFLKLI